MTDRIFQDMKDLLAATYEDWIVDKKNLSFEEYALPIVGMNLAMQYNPEEVAIAVRDRRIKALLRFYILDTGEKQ